jgi:hypothetical protein
VGLAWQNSGEGLSGNWVVLKVQTTLLECDENDSLRFPHLVSFLGLFFSVKIKTLEGLNA